MESDTKGQAPQDRPSQTPKDQKSRNSKFRVSHTPIIIDDGSASINFADMYTEIRPGEFLGEDLIIDRVELLDKNPPNNDHVSVCRKLQPGRDYKITVQCAGKDFEVGVEGDNIRIKFDQDEYGPADAPDGRLKFKNNGRKIMGIKIQDESGTVVHQCRLVPGNGRCQVAIVDDHLDEDLR